MMIDYLTVIYKNYELLDIQRSIFKSIFSPEQYRLVIVDNTPDSEKKPITPENNEIIVFRNSVDEFDGISHGFAIDYGLTFTKSKIVCILDSDFFLLNKNIHNYIIDKFDQGYVAVGAEWHDGEATIPVVNAFPEKFKDIPCCFCGYYDSVLARSNSWAIAPWEIDRSTSYIEVGWRIRKYIFENKIKTLSWKSNSIGYGNCYFKNENEELMGVHYVAGSHRRWNQNSKNEVINYLRDYIDVT
nr:MAG: hypothetical protein [Caudoviricetes sp.]